MKGFDLFIEKLTRQKLWEGSVELKRNEFLKRKGSTDTRLYYIRSGSLRIFVDDEENEHTIRFGYQNDLITSLDSFITEQPSDLYIQALKKSELLYINKASYLKFIQQEESNRQMWEQMLIGLIYQQMEREMDLLTTSPEKRYQRVLERSPQLFQEIPHKYIANYLRMTPETLSRIKKS